MSRSPYYQQFTVEWHGRFPLDMLRYDCCFPASEEAVAVIYDTLVEPTVGKHTARIGRLVRRKGDMPCVDRWESFCARVCDIRTD